MHNLEIYCFQEIKINKGIPIFLFAKKAFTNYESKQIYSKKLKQFHK